MANVKFAFLLIVLYACHVCAIYNTLEDHVLADIEQRLSSLELDNRRLWIENKQIHKTNINLKQEIRQGMTEYQKMQKSVRQLEVENRHFMQLVENIQEKIRLLVEEQDQHKSTASQDIHRNILKSKDNTWTARTDFPYSVPYRVFKSVSSAFSQTERSDSNGKQYNSEKFNKNRDTDVIGSFVEDRPSMPVQSSKNGSIASVYAHLRNVQSKSRRNARAAGPSSAVAFHTRLTSDLYNPGDDQTIVMSDVLTNDGSAYDRFSGHFTSPVSGLYAFFVTAVSYSDKNIETELLKNGYTIGKLVSGSTGQFGSSSNTVIVNAQQGDHFWVRVNDHFHDSGKVLDHYFTTFSGFLLY